MASRKLVRDLLLLKRSLLLPFTSHQTSRLRFLEAEYSSGIRRHSVLNEFSKKIKGEVDRNPEFKQSIKELREKADELKGVKEKLKVKTKHKTKKLYKHVDEVWAEAEASAKKVSYNVKEKISAATNEVKGTLGIGKQDSLGSTGSSTKEGAGAKHKSHASPEEEQNQQSRTRNASDSFFGKFNSTISSPDVAAAFQKLNEAKLANVAKKGYEVVKEELSSNPTWRRGVPFTPNGERSTRIEVVVVPSKQSQWSKKFNEFKEKVN